MLGLSNCIQNEVKTWDFISSEVIHSGRTHMLIKKSGATRKAINRFDLLMDFDFVLVSQRRLSARSLYYAGHMIRADIGKLSDNHK